MEKTSFAAAFPPLYCAAVPGDLPALRRWPLTPVHMAYQVRSGPQLLRITHPGLIHGGILMADTAQLRQWNAPEPLLRQAVGECRARQAQGFCLNWSQPPTPPALELTAALEQALNEAGLALWVPENYGGACSTAKVLISSALSGGTLRRRLTDACEQFGPERVILAVERMAHRFPLPSPTGQGEPVPRETLAALLREDVSPCRSEEFCASYFTRREGGQIALYLYDDEASLRSKLALAGELGLFAGLMAWPEVQDTIGALRLHRGADNRSPAVPQSRRENR